MRRLRHSATKHKCETCVATALIEGASPHISGWEDAFQRSLSGRIIERTCVIMGLKSIRDLASFDLISPRQSKYCYET